MENQAGKSGEEIQARKIGQGHACSLKSTPSRPGRCSPERPREADVFTDEQIASVERGHALKPIPRLASRTNRGKKF